MTLAILTERPNLNFFPPKSFLNYIRVNLQQTFVPNLNGRRFRNTRNNRYGFEPQLWIEVIYGPLEGGCIVGSGGVTLRVNMFQFRRKGTFKP